MRISQAETALRRAREQIQQRHALSVAASLDGMWEWDVKSGAAWYSDRFAELLGYDPEEVQRAVGFLRDAGHPDDVDAMWAAVERHLADGTPYDVECRLRRRAGEYGWFRARGRAQREEVDAL